MMKGAMLARPFFAGNIPVFQPISGNHSLKVKILTCSNWFGDTHYVPNIKVFVLLLR